MSLREIPIPLEARTVGALLARKAQEQGERLFLLFEGSRYTYGQAHAITDGLAAGFYAAGVRPGDHVATLLDNSPEALWTYFALGKLGAVAVPLNTAMKGDLLLSVLNHCGATTLVIEPAWLPRYMAVRAGCPRLCRLILTEGDENPIPEMPGVHPWPWRQVMRKGASPPDIPVSFKDTFLLMYTSGTTGPSKGSISPHAYPVTYGMQRAQAFGYQPDDILYTCLPLFHGNALIGTCFSALVADAAIALSRRFSARTFWDEIRDTGATQCNLLGAMANILWQQPPSSADRDHRLRQCTMVPLPEFSSAFEARFGLQLTSVYALSDYGMGTLLAPGHPPSKARSAGRPAPQVEIAILDADDIALPVGKVGEIALRAREPWTTGQGYWRMPEASLEARRNLWFHSGDRGYLDEDGYLYFVDRQKDAIRRRGENISSWEVENLITRHPDVLEVAAFPVRAEMSEDEVMVSVVRRERSALTEADLIRYCQDNMAYFMVPRYVEFVDALPRTMTQKVEKYKLRAQAELRLADVWDRERAGIRVTR